MKSNIEGQIEKQNQEKDRRRAIKIMMAKIEQKNK